MIAKKQRGSSAVEFALVAPLLFVILFGIIEFSIALFDQAMITNASREGARQGILWKNGLKTIEQVTTEMNSTITTATNGNMISLSGSKTVTPNCTFKDNKMEPGNLVTCHVDFTYSFLVLKPLVGLLGSNTFPGSLTLRSTTVMRME